MSITRFIVRAEITLEVNVPTTEDIDADRHVAEDLAQEYLDRRIQERKTGDHTVRVLDRETSYPEHDPREDDVPR